jgi:macrolide-specific efflux system membrane fusion protein
MTRYHWLLLLILAAAGLGGWKLARKPAAPKTVSYIVQRGDIRRTVQSSGTIEPKNRVEILPPTSGRADRILVDQGQVVKKGQTLAWLSSTDRAALLDAAVEQGATTYSQWERVYRPTPILAPVDGQVIERGFVEGQTIQSGKALFVMADRLVVRARVDESDIAKISVGQSAQVSADAFPDKPFKGIVKLIDYQSKVVANVSAYTVELEPDGADPGLRSGMTAKVDFVSDERRDVLMLPVAAVGDSKGTKADLRVRTPSGEKLVSASLGLSDGSNIEVSSGLSAGDEVVVDAPDFNAPEASRNPFDPFSSKSKKDEKKK